MVEAASFDQPKVVAKEAHKIIPVIPPHWKPAASVRSKPAESDDDDVAVRRQGLEQRRSIGGSIGIAHEEMQN
ncbi:MAG: hypothetical protein WAL40_16960, partial [Rhodoplanes sp.]